MFKNFLFNREEEKGSKELVDDDRTLKLREERLNIVKNWVKTGDVTIRKEVVTEEKNIIVPIKREELVIEKKVFDEKNFSEIDDNAEVIRIPISEERIDIVKNTVILEDVSVYKRQFEEIEKIEEKLKREGIHIETTGNAVVLENKDKKEF